MKTLILCVFAVCSLSALAASEIQSRYQQERARCDDPRVDRKACLREAGAAQIEARRGTLGQENTDFEKNRLARCDVHKDADDREYCLRRMRGEGTTTGSVEGGGILRELIVVVPAEETAGVAPVTPAAR